MEWPQSGAGLSTRLPACKETNIGNPFLLVSTQPEEASTRVAMRNFCPPLSPLENAVPIMKVEGRSWNSLGLSNHSWLFFFVCLVGWLSYREQTQQHLKHSESAKPHLPMCAPWPLPSSLGLLLLPRLLWKGARAPSFTPQGVQLPDLPVADSAAHPCPRRPSPAQMPRVRAELSVGVVPPPHTRWFCVCF